MSLAGPLSVPPPFASPLQAAQAAAEALAAVLRVARVLAEAGHRVDLSGIDDVTGRLCARLLDLPPPQSRSLRPLLHQLLGEALALEAALKPAARSRPERPPEPCPH